jgi:hypothetical protein
MAEFLNGSVQTFVKVDKCIGGPQSASKFLAGDDFSGMLQEHGENLKGLILDVNQSPAAVKLTGRKIHLEEPKAKAARPIGWDLHEGLRKSSVSLP